MDLDQFETLVGEEFPRAVPEKFRTLIANVAFLVEDEPSEDVRKEQALAEGETLLGYYRGIPHPARGDLYGIGATLPDTVTLYRLPLIEEAEALRERHGGTYEEAMRRAIRETIWHEVAHYFGMDEHEVNRRETERDTM